MRHDLRLSDGLTPWLAALAIACSIAACATAPGPAATVAPAAAPATEPRATIRWDPWGIPHVTAEDDEALFYAWGWAQARNHGDLLLRNIGQARGRGAEYWGEEHLDDDRWYRLWQVDEKGAEVYHALEPEIRAHVDAFAAGIDRYLRDHPEAISDDVARVVTALGGAPGDDDPLDLLAARYRENERCATRTFLEEAGVPFEFWSRVGD